MKINFVFATALALFVFAFAVSAQEKVTSFAGVWTLDVSKSKLDERARIESMTLTVTQTDKDITIESKTVRAARPEGSPGGTGGGGGMGRGGGFGSGDATTTYSLAGKETTIEQESPMGKVPVTMKAKLEAGKLSLSSSRTFAGPDGAITATTTEAWTMSEDGKTLTVVREQASPRGTSSSTLVFAKKP